MLGKNKSKLKKKADQKRSSASADPKPLAVKVEKIKTEDDSAPRATGDVEKSVSLIENIAFSESLDQFICSVGSCDYRSTELAGLMSHVREHDEKWSGSCLVCKEMVNVASSSLPLAEEVKHLQERHMPKSSVPAVQPALQVIAAGADLAAVARPMIKCRRVSGDRLSTMKAGEAAASNAGQLQISSAVSLSSERIINFPANATILSSGSGFNDNPLKPWTNCPLSKSSKATQLLLRDTSLVALFKCMGINCHFSTGDADRMLQHLQHHEDYVTTQQMSADDLAQLDHLSWLECCYCDTMVDTCNLLVQHVQNEHAASIYQCPYCFYRSAATANVEVHMNEYHGRKDKMIIQCVGESKQLHSEIVVMMAGAEKNVIPIECGDEGMTTLIDAP